MRRGAMWLMKRATATAERDRDDDGDRRRQDRAEGERRDVVDEALAVGQVGGACGDRRHGIGDQEDRDPGEQRKHGHRSDHRGVREDPVAGRRLPPLAEARIWPAWVVVSAWASISLLMETVRGPRAPGPGPPLRGYLWISRRSR